MDNGVFCAWALSVPKITAKKAIVFFTLCILRKCRIGFKYSSG
jgi:hypothetical protein